MKNLLLSLTLLTAMACEPEPTTTEAVIVTEIETETVEVSKSNCIRSINGVKFAERIFTSSVHVGTPHYTLITQVDACESHWYKVELSYTLHTEGPTFLSNQKEYNTFQRPLMIARDLGASGHIESIEYDLTLTDSEGTVTVLSGTQLF